MSTVQTIPQNLLINNRHRNGDRRMAERRKRSVGVQIERRHAEQRRRPGARRQLDLNALYVQSSQHADRLCSELVRVPADNPISRLLVLQKFLLDRRPRQSNAWIMRWARRLRETYYGSNREGMCWAVFRALHEVASATRAR